MGFIDVKRIGQSFFGKAGQEVKLTATALLALGASRVALANKGQIFGVQGGFAPVFVVVGAGQVVGQVFVFGKMIDDNAGGYAVVGVAVVWENLVVAHRAERIVHAVWIYFELQGRHGNTAIFAVGAGAKQDGHRENQTDKQAVPYDRTAFQTRHHTPKLNKKREISKFKKKAYLCRVNFVVICLCDVVVGVFCYLFAMAQIKYYSKEGLQKLKDELDRLVKVERPNISRQIAEARDKGDLSENAEYDAAKEAQGLCELKIAKLQQELANARLIDESKLDTSKVLLLSTVKIKNLKNGAKMTYTLVPENEADLKTGKISISSPIAQGLLGKSVGDKVDITVPAGTIPFEITEISR